MLANHTGSPTINHVSAAEEWERSRDMVVVAQGPFKNDRKAKESSLQEVDGLIIGHTHWGVGGVWNWRNLRRLEQNKYRAEICTKRKT